MTEAMPFLQKAILLSYAPRPFRESFFLVSYLPSTFFTVALMFGAVSPYISINLTAGPE